MDTDFQTKTKVLLKLFKAILGPQDSVEKMKAEYENRRNA